MSSIQYLIIAMAGERRDRGSPGHRVGMIILVPENLFSERLP